MYCKYPTRPKNYFLVTPKTTTGVIVLPTLASPSYTPPVKTPNTNKRDMKIV